MYLVRLSIYRGQDDLESSRLLAIEEHEDRAIDVAQSHIKLLKLPDWEELPCCYNNSFVKEFTGRDQFNHRKRIYSFTVDEWNGEHPFWLV